LNNLFYHKICVDLLNEFKDLEGNYICKENNNNIQNIINEFNNNNSFNYNNIQNNNNEMNIINKNPNEKEDYSYECLNRDS